MAIIKLLFIQMDLSRSWRDVLGDPPPVSDLFHGDRESRKKWMTFNKKKWDFQRQQRKACRDTSFVSGAPPKSGPASGFHFYSIG